MERSATFTTLTPRQPLTPTPYALRAQTALTVWLGPGNAIGTNADAATIGGGAGNLIGSGAYNATISGGREAIIHDRAFGATVSDVVSTNANSWTVRASGGVTFFTDTNLASGAVLSPGSGSWSSLSDRAAKDDVLQVDARAVLDKLASMPLSTWRYKAQAPAVRHVGPMAQDFRAAFGVGENERHISSVDADGVALAAIQGLNEKVEGRSQKAEVRIQKLEAENVELRARLAALEELLKAQIQK